jgi:hypothetical protein
MMGGSPLTVRTPARSRFRRQKTPEARGERNPWGIQNGKGRARADRRTVLDGWAAVPPKRWLCYSLPLAWRTTCIMTSCRLVPAAFRGSMLRTRAVRSSKRS